MAFPVQPASRGRELEQSCAEQGSQLCLGARVGSQGLVWAAGSTSWLLLPHTMVPHAGRVTNGGSGTRTPTAPWLRPRVAAAPGSWVGVDGWCRRS